MYLVFAIIKVLLQLYILLYTNAVDTVWNIVDINHKYNMIIFNDNRDTNDIHNHNHINTGEEITYTDLNNDGYLLLFLLLVNFLLPPGLIWNSYLHIHWLANFVDFSLLINMLLLYNFNTKRNLIYTTYMTLICNSTAYLLYLVR